MFRKVPFRCRSEGGDGVSAASDNALGSPADGDDDNDQALARVQPGRYTAIYVRHEGMLVFRQPKLRVTFRLFAHPDLLLPRWYRVIGYRGGRVSARSQSDLVREISAVLGARVRPDRIPVASLANVPVIVLIRTVTNDREQNALAAVNHYEVIQRVEGKAE